MTRLSLFDFDHAETPLCTVSELTAQIKMLLEAGFAGASVRSAAEVIGAARDPGSRLAHIIEASTR